MKSILLVLILVFIPLKANAFSFDENKASEYCKDKWSKRGVLDQGMYNFCMDRQIEGFEDINFFITKYNEVDLINEIITFAQKKWLTRKTYEYGMVAFEIEQQAEAFLDIKWGLDNGKISEDVLVKCKNKWITDEEPQWNMVEFCIEN